MVLLIILTSQSVSCSQRLFIIHSHNLNKIMLMMSRNNLLTKVANIGTATEIFVVKVLM